MAEALGTLIVCRAPIITRIASTGYARFSASALKQDEQQQGLAERPWIDGLQLPHSAGEPDEYSDWRASGELAASSAP
jgi:hypothetical protein